MQLVSPQGIAGSAGMPDKIGPHLPEFRANLITPNDAVDLGLGPDGATCRGFVVTTAGTTLVGVLKGGGTATLAGLALNTIYRLELTRINATGTGATGILALY